MKAYTPENMRAADRYTIDALGIPGTVLMDRAADALLEELTEHLGKSRRFVILCGKGNNGGDGWALAVKLCGMFENTVCISVLGDPVTDDAMHFYKKCTEMACGGYPLKVIDASTDLNASLLETDNADVIIETIFGTGFSGNIEKDSTAGMLIRRCNEKRAFKLAADIPAGADALSGRCSDIAFSADVTVTFAKPKIGMFSYPAREMCGRIVTADIGIPEDVFESFGSKHEICDDKTVLKYIPKRYANSNKGSYGKLLVYAGSRDMPGAAQLALSGALRCGVGLAAFASEPYVTDLMKHRMSEPVFLNVSDGDDGTNSLISYSQRCSALLIGCGLGSSEETKKRVIRLIKECNCPIILDADGINSVSDNINVITESKSKILLTPHPLEFSRISKKPLSEICANRLECAVEFSKQYGCTLLLKGAGTVICESDGRVCIIPVSCSALSKGGSGDVLSGMISSFAAQGAPLYESAVVGAYLHGMAGISLAREYSEYGVMPSDIPEMSAKILASMI